MHLFGKIQVECRGVEACRRADHGMATGKIQVFGRVPEIFPDRNNGMDSRRLSAAQHLRKIGIEDRITQVRMGIDEGRHAF